MLKTVEHECVEFHEQIHPQIKIKPMYYELGFSPSASIFGRKLVLDKLLQALLNIPKEYGFLIWDVYRPREVQGKLFNWMKGEIKQKHPHLSDSEVSQEASKYMSPPSKVGDTYCPPHLSGGAIDLTLFDLSNGVELEMGTPFDDCTHIAHRDYFDSIVIDSKEKEQIRKNRVLLRSAMESVGFTSYQYEWWHFDIGNIFWSKAVNHSPLFGPLFEDQEWPKHKIN